MKSFRELLVENEEEFEYYLKSVYDLYLPDMIDEVILALGNYQIRDIQPHKYVPFEKQNKDFIHYPNSSSYTLKIITGYPIEDYYVALSQVCMRSKIPEDALLLWKKGETPKPVESPNYENATEIEEVPNAQELVGTSRIGSFIKELQDEAKAGEPIEFGESDESFVVSHDAMSRVFGKPHKKGFYIVERFNHDDVVKVRVEGPFGFKPMNYELVESIYDDNVNILSENRNSTRVVYEAILPSFPASMNSPHDPYHELNRNRMSRDKQKYEVEVQNVDTGRVFKLVVDAYSKQAARDKGISLVAREQGINTSALLALKPEKDSSSVN